MQEKRPQLAAVVVDRGASGGDFEPPVWKHSLQFKIPKRPRGDLLTDGQSVEPRVAENIQPHNHNYARAAVTADPPSPATTADPPSPATTADMPRSAITADPPCQEKAPGIRIFLQPVVLGKKGEAVITKPRRCGRCSACAYKSGSCHNCRKPCLRQGCSFREICKKI